MPVTLSALPVTLPVIGLVTVKLLNTPTLVKLALTTLDASVVPVKSVAAPEAAMVISAVPSKGTPLIFFESANFVAVAALPVTLPAIGLVTVKLFNVPTLVKLAFTTFEASVVPVILEAATSAIFESVTAKSANFILVMLPSAIPALGALAAT